MRRAALALALLAAACGNGGHKLTVFAAASLQQALPRDAADYNFAGSQELVAQLQNGAKADVVVTADEATMQTLVDAAIAHGPVAVAANELAIATTRRDVRTLADLARPDVSVVVADPSVPLGKLTQQALAKAGVTVKPWSRELDAATALQKVAGGEADAAIVYVSQFAGGVTIVTIPREHNVRTRYMAAAFTAEGRDYIDKLPAQLRRGGLLAP